MIRRLVPPAIAIGILLGSAAALGTLLDRRLSFHSVFYRPEPLPTPRDRALADLERARREREQKERERAELLAHLDTDTMVELGREIVYGRGLCFNCHHVGEDGRGNVGPNLADVGARAGTRRPGMSDVEYLAESLYEPNAFVVPEFSAGMVPANQPPIGLDDLEILMVIAYLQSLGGTPTVTPDTVLPYHEAEAAQAAQTPQNSETGDPSP